MDSNQFCYMLREARKLTGVRVIDVCYKLRKTERTINRLIKGDADNTMGKIFPFLNAINCEILIQDGDKTVIVNSEEALHNWVSPILSATPQRKLAEIFDVSQPTIGSILKGGPIRQSLFLKFVDYTGSKIYIQPIDNMPIDATADCDIDPDLQDDPQLI